MIGRAQFCSSDLSDGGGCVCEREKFISTPYTYNKDILEKYRKVEMI